MHTQETFFPPPPCLTFSLARQSWATISCLLWPARLIVSSFSLSLPGKEDFFLIVISETLSLLTPLQVLSFYHSYSPFSCTSLPPHPGFFHPPITVFCSQPFIPAKLISTVPLFLFPFDRGGALSRLCSLRHYIYRTTCPSLCSFSRDARPPVFNRQQCDLAPSI